MANWNNVPRRQAGRGDGSMPGPKVNPMTPDPTGPDNPCHTPATGPALPSGMGSAGRYRDV